MNVVCKKGKCYDLDALDYELDNLGRKMNLADKIENDMLKAEV